MVYGYKESMDTENEEFFLAASSPLVICWDPQETASLI